MFVRRGWVRFVVGFEDERGFGRWRGGEGRRRGGRREERRLDYRGFLAFWALGIGELWGRFKLGRDIRFVF